MLINIDIDEEELKSQILEGVSIEKAVAGAVSGCQYELQNKLESAIKKTTEYKNTYSSIDEKRIKQTIQIIANNSVVEKLKGEIRTYVVLESQLPKIVKSYVNDFLKEYVQEEIIKQIRKVYTIEIGVKKNVQVEEVEESKDNLKSKENKKT
jgi:hypothetical protein